MHCLMMACKWIETLKLRIGWTNIFNPLLDQFSNGAQSGVAVVVNSKDTWSNDDHADGKAKKKAFEHWTTCFLSYKKPMTVSMSFHQYLAGSIVE